MTPVQAIIAKELRSYFVSPVVYAVGSVFLLIVGLLELKAISMTLEDVFLQLTRHEEGLAPDAVVASAEPAGQPA